MDVTGRRLGVLAAVQARPGITAARLAERFGVSERTARRDVGHLRDLGYRIDGEGGRHGGYVLGAGAGVPPLVLDADEALAVALGLMNLTDAEGLADVAVTALAKLQEGLPSPLAARVAAVADTLDGDRRPAELGRARRPMIPGGVLLTVALACRAGESLRLRPRGGRGRDVQPHRLVRLGARWYLIAYATDAGDWRTFRLDRLDEVRPTGARLAAPPPPADPVGFVRTGVAVAGWPTELVVRLHADIELARHMVPPTVGLIQADGDPYTCLLRMGTDDLDRAARLLLRLDVDFDVVSPPALTTALHQLGRWLAQRYGPGSA